VVLGEKTFGKGSVQSILPLQDGSALRLTTAKYYTPSHRVIHEEGITPDIVVPLTPEEDNAVVSLRTPGQLENLEPKERRAVLNIGDPQLDRAIDLLKGITLFTHRSPEGEQRVAQRGS
jgi:carboxyl-terminal processing protease